MQNTAPEIAISDLNALLASLGACRYSSEDYLLKSQLVINQLMVLKDAIADGTLQNLDSEMEDLYYKLVYEYIFAAKSAVYRTPGAESKIIMSKRLNPYCQG
jgi:hypothetical protein